MARMTLEELTKQLTAVYGDALRAVVLYGSAARGEKVTKHSDLNVLVVVDAIGMEHLRREAAVATAWREAGNPPPLTLTLEEWRGSADIFPIEYGDILAHHRVLAGSLPLDGIEVDRRDLRLQLEHEAMGKLLRLRHAIITAGSDERAQREILERSISSLLTLMRAAARLLAGAPPADSEQLLAMLAEGSGLDTTPFLRVVRFARGAEPLDGAGVSETLERYMAATQAFVRWLDAHQT
jgi:hypothetical protein